MKTKELQTKTSRIRMAVLSFVLLMLLTGSINAQHHHGPPPPPPNVDSIIAAQLHQLDSIFNSHPHDTLPVVGHNHGGIDTIFSHPKPPIWDSIHPVCSQHGNDSIIGPPDSIWIGHIHFGHDSIPGPPPGDSTSTAGGHHDHDSIPSPPPPPNWGDSISTWIGQHGHDSVPPPPPPPNWGDSTWAGGGHQDSSGSTPPHHKDLLIGSDNNASVSMLVFPNPVFETATIRIQNAASTVTFRMYESTGRLVTNLQNLSNGDYQLTKGNLTGGIYFYEMLDGNTIASKGSLVIQ